MRFRTVTVTALLFASIAFSQTPDKVQARCADRQRINADRLQSGLPSFGTPEECLPAPKVYDLSTQPSPQARQETLTILRTVLDLQYLSLGSEAPTMTVHATEDQLTMVDWLLRELNNPPPAPRLRNVPVEAFPVPASEQYRLARTNDEVIRVFFLAHTETPRGIQEMLTILRTVGDVQRLFNYSEQEALVVRAPAAQMAMTAYLIDALDIAPGSSAASPEFQYKPPTGGSDMLRVFYLAHATSLQGIQEIMTVLRLVGGISKVFNATAPFALAVRGTASDIATSEWLIQSLDIPVDAHVNAPADIREYNIPGATQGDGFIRVFYPVHNSTSAGLQQAIAALRAKMPTLKVFAFHSPAALAVRGSADQIAQSGQIIQQQEQPAVAVP
jgi:hypothetical protein